MADSAGFEDRVRRELGDLAAHAAERADPPSAGQVRHRGERRRLVSIAAAATGVAVLGAGVLLYAGPLTDDGVAPVVAPSESSSPTATPSPPAPPPPPPPPTTEVPTTPASPAPSSPSTPPPSATAPEYPATEIPAGFALPNEGDENGDPEFSDWETVEQLDTPWAWTVCGVDAYEGDAARTDFRQVAMGGPEATAANALAVYADAEVAVEVMAAMRAAIEECDEDASNSGFVTRWQLRVLAVGGQSFLAASTSTAPSGDPASGGHQVAVVRLGSAIYATYVFADGRPTVSDALAAELEAALIEFTPELCVFTVAGC